jgi:hypothetical protein
VLVPPPAVVAVEGVEVGREPSSAEVAYCVGGHAVDLVPGGVEQGQP